ncbi:Dolichyl-phosphate-mannose-protein mannosyltransferase [Amycolatopsis arida]|uniref:Dolichyl-phosphate-mannose-protein mannosyltransferase n=1 Tax=Amycolatopsis arida TaxID=587909 RepID=A0A1I5V146_9PSEU|nr:glycosyltransferase family 39 protein [Amycolatopsis arida]TDX91108.1 dolichyl-phosphate-mannose-protein mannosyltransferase [Amycolatopsis arida]SFQ01215.1 Dolichyl-phosphate-mannose-protein mannosyltransferase [Amycolatopsis arida]
MSGRGAGYALSGVEPGAARSPRGRLPAAVYAHAAGVYLLVQAVGVGVLALLAARHDLTLLGRLTAWDGAWYLSLVEYGYDGVAPGLRDAHGEIFPEAPLAFFPLYPALVVGLAQLPGVGEVGAAITVSVLCGLVMALGLVRLARHLDPRPRVGLLAVALVAGAPMAITFAMVYTEALFCALAVWALVFVLERQWVLAGVACLLAGLARSTASVLIGAVVLAALVAAWRGRDRAAALACVVLAPLGLLGFWGFVAVRTGSLTGWSDIEWRGWNTRYDFGGETVGFVLDTLAEGPSVMQVGAVLAVFAAIGLGVLAFRRLPWPLALYGAGVVLLVVGTAGLPAAKPRFLLPAMVVLLLPVAMALARRSRNTMLALTVAFVALGVWYGGYALTGWRYAI